MSSRYNVILMACALVLSTLLFSGCSDDEECETADSACGEFTACCSSDQCHYEWNGRTYDCDGTNCNQAARELANDMCGKSSGAMSEERAAVIDNILQVGHLQTIKARYGTP